MLIAIGSWSTVGGPKGRIRREREGLAGPVTGCGLLQVLPVAFASAEVV